MKLLSGKKALFGPGGGMGGPRKPISLILGAIFLVLGVVPLLNSFGVIAFSIPVIPTGIILWILALVGGVVLLWDAIGENLDIMGMQQQLKMATFVVALVLLAIGSIPILNSFGVIGFGLPAFIDTINNILFLVVGLLLVYGGTQGF